MPEAIRTLTPEQEARWAQEHAAIPRCPTCGYAVALHTRGSLQGAIAGLHAKRKPSLRERIFGA